MTISKSTAVVTGASGGIGMSIAEGLATRGADHVGIVDISSQCDSVAKELATRHPDCQFHGFSGDVTDPQFRESVFTELERPGKPVSICVPAAGILRDGLAVRIDRESGDSALYPESEFRRTLEVNLVHPIYWAMETIASVARDRAAQGRGQWQTEDGPQGAVVLVGSVSSRGNRGQISYAASKSALVGASATLNIEGLYHGVQTKIVHPGFVDTPMVDSIDQDYFDTHLKPLIGLGRKIKPREIADIVCAMIENPALSGQVWADASLTPLA